MVVRPRFAVEISMLSFTVSEIYVLPAWVAILLFPVIVFEITVFEIAMVDSLSFAVEKKQIKNTFLSKRLGVVYPKRTRCV